MKIGFFTWEYPPRIVGGLGTYSQYITRDISVLGNDVVVFTPNTGNLKTFEKMDGIEVYRLTGIDSTEAMRLFVRDDLRSWGDNLSFFNSVFTNDVLCSSKFYELAVTEKFDIVCCHDWLAAMAGITLKEKLGIPMVFHVHSTEWGRSIGPGSQTVHDIERRTAEVADAVITVSYAMKEDLINHGWPGEKIHVVWNGIDPYRYSPYIIKEEDVSKIRERYGIGKDEKMVLYLGRLNWVKGVMSLVYAMPSVLREHPEARLVILGTGDDENPIRELVRTLDIADRVVLRFEFVPEDERILHYAASDMCVFPSVYEPFGIVSLEAMAMEKPIVVGASGISGLKEQVVCCGTEQTGVHVNARDPQDIAWGINQVLSDDQAATLWGIRARKRVLENFTWEETAKKTLEVYRGLAR